MYSKKRIVPAQLVQVGTKNIIPRRKILNSL